MDIQRYSRLLVLIVLLVGVGVRSAEATPHSQQSRGTTYTVCYPGGCNFVNLFSALDVASPIQSGDTLQLLDNNDGDLDGFAADNRLVINKSITIVGEGKDAGGTEIFGQILEERLFQIAGDATQVTFKDLTMTSEFNQNAPPLRGGCIVATGASSKIILDNVRLRNCYVTENGGAVYTNGSIELINAEIVSNIAANRGGGIYAKGNVTLDNAFVFDNQANGLSGDGGGIYTHGNLTVTNNSSILGNASVGNGGGAYVLGASTITTSSKINNNTADEDGGGIYGVGTITIANAGVETNWSGSDGGGVYGVDIDINSSTIKDNQAVGNGGGVYSSGGVVNIESGATIQNNQADGNGGGVYGTTVYSMNPITTLYSVIINNHADGKGGGVYAADFTGENVGISSNDALHGGGIYVTNSVDLAESTLINSNSATGSGGGLYIYNTTTTQVSLISAVTFLSNSASGVGGAIYHKAGGLIDIETSTFKDNQAVYGGALSIRAAAGSLFNRSLLESNHATLGGGGAYVYVNAQVDFVNSTISGNTSDGDGGGLFFANGAFGNLWNVTVANNIANHDGDGSGRGGGLYRIGPSGGVMLANTIVGDNQHLPPSLGTFAPDCSGAFSSQGYNLIENRGSALGGPPCQIATTNNLLGVNPFLIGLNDLGGPTKTHGLANGQLGISPAINAGNPAGCLDHNGATLAIDQRGVARSNRCDIGAYESTSTIPTVVGLVGHGANSAELNPLLPLFLTILLLTLSTLFYQKQSSLHRTASTKNSWTLFERLIM